MASAFGHILVTTALGTAYSKKILDKRFLLIGAFCSLLPDFDVMTFHWGIPYESFWGHRGFSHSLLFAIIVGTLVTYLFYNKQFFSRNGLTYSVYFSLCTASHGIIDGLTNGGLGIAFFSPFDNGRYFLPWRPIEVSPLGIDPFISDRGLEVIQSELVWIGLPCVLFASLNFILKRFFPPE